MTWSLAFICRVLEDEVRNTVVMTRSLALVRVTENEVRDAVAMMRSLALVYAMEDEVGDVDREDRNQQEQQQQLPCDSNIRCCEDQQRKQVS